MLWAFKLSILLGSPYEPTSEDNQFSLIKTIRLQSVHRKENRMTAQFPERLHYQNREYSMCTNPLEKYFELTGIRPKFVETCTALWRGYVGKWVIIHERLYLIGIEGCLSNGTSAFSSRSATLEDIFPGFPKRVFAHWYTGTVRLPYGNRLDYVHGGYGSTYEYDLMIEVSQGVITSTTIRENTVPEKTSFSFEKIIERIESKEAVKAQETQRDLFL